MIPIKNCSNKRLGGGAVVVERLPSKCEALITNKKKRKKNHKNCSKKGKRGIRNSIRRINLIKVHYIHVWK
jgi:hypothetical protein